jgi:hypothetical protein
MSTDRNAELRRKLMGFIISQAIVAVTAAGVVDRLATGPSTCEDLAAVAGVDVDALRRYLRVLVAEGVLAQPADDVFALTPMGALLRADTPGSLSHFAVLMSGEAYLAWGQVEHALRTGKSGFEAAYGEPYFSWLAEHPDEQARFNRAQAGLVERRLLPLLERDWTGMSMVVDVGGGNGALLMALLADRPGLRGILLDLPTVVAAAAAALAEAGLADRCQCVPGSFFDDVPSGADVYVLAQILHDWDDEHAVAVLSRCRAAIPAHGRLLVLEQVVPVDDRPHPAKLLDLHMLMMLGGRERTETEWRQLLARGGFDTVDVTHTARSSLIEARPA